MSIALVDSSILCNVLNLPRRNQNRQVVLDQLRAHIQNGVTLLLPVATILETGNHIAHIDNGHQRRTAAEIFVKQVKQALHNNVPWTVSLPLLDPETLGTYLDEFPDSAMRGIGLGDLSIVKEFERQCTLHQAQRVFIWSLDKHLCAYDRAPRI